MQLIICSLCCLSHQPGFVHLAYFSFPASFLTYFDHLDAIWDVLKKTVNGHNDPGRYRSFINIPGATWGKPWKPQNGPWYHIHPRHGPPGHPPQWMPPSPGTRCLPPPRWKSICLPLLRCQPVICMIPRRRPLSPACLVEMLPLWQPDRRAPPKPPAPPQLFSLTINAGTNLTPFPCLAFVNHHPFFY